MYKATLLVIIYVYETKQIILVPSDDGVIPLTGYQVVEIKYRPFCI